MRARTASICMPAWWCPPGSATDSSGSVAYTLRPPVPSDRLHVMGDGQVMLQLRHRWADGTTHLVFDPVELLGRLARPLDPESPRCRERPVSVVEIAVHELDAAAGEQTVVGPLHWHERFPVPLHGIEPQGEVGNAHDGLMNLRGLEDRTPLHHRAHRLRSWLQDRLVIYQQPKQVVCVEALPRNSLGKVLRRELRDALASAADRARP